MGWWVGDRNLRNLGLPILEILGLEIFSTTNRWMSSSHIAFLWLHVDIKMLNNTFVGFTMCANISISTQTPQLSCCCRFKEFLSKHVHLMCYRICVRALTAIITYHNRWGRLINICLQLVIDAWEVRGAFQTNRFSPFLLLVYILYPGKTDQEMVASVWLIIHLPSMWSSWPAMATMPWYAAFLCDFSDQF